MTDELRERLDEAAHRFKHGDPAKCISQEEAEPLFESGGRPVVCLWNLWPHQDADKLADALAAAGLSVALSHTTGATG